MRESNHSVQHKPTSYGNKSKHTYKSIIQRHQQKGHELKQITSVNKKTKHS
ncbi:hypothetical protein HanXRQr2_Chr10g0451951 [Helianthus annuus]|uniref:Uncharacterized protein n=1 Tax=Helianthus annuus TaxID=4232 RepID=A0A9K3N5C2_HELAN|nr:hypothetical protein HanXRQr2_Chr10g0451951 [Helianthus annuus]